MITHRLYPNWLEINRYSRQIRFAPLGETGQQRLAAGRVAVIGCGALGSLAAEILVRAGVGWVRLVDRDFVELSNLQRQFLFDETDAADAIPKAVAAARRLGRVNSEVRMEAETADLTARNASDLLGGADLIVDGTDNFEARYLINDWCVRSGTPWIYGGAVGSYGVTMAIVPARGPCFRCVYPEPPGGVQPTCETAGVLAPVTAVVSSLQAAAALKILSGNADDLRLDLTTVDVWTGDIRQIGNLARDPDCPCCGRREFPYLDGSRRAPISLCGRNAVQIHERERPVDLGELAAALAGVGEVRNNGFALRAQVEGYDLTVFPDGRAIVKGTTDPGVARSLYARYVGA